MTLYSSNEHYTILLFEFKSLLVISIDNKLDVWETHFVIFNRLYVQQIFYGNESVWSDLDALFLCAMAEYV